MAIKRKRAESIYIVLPAPIRNWQLISPNLGYTISCRIALKKPLRRKLGYIIKIRYSYGVGKMAHGPAHFKNVNNCFIVSKVPK